MFNISNRPTNDISCSIKQDSSNWSGDGQPIFNERLTLVWFGAEEFDTNNIHNSTIQETGSALGTHEAITLQDTSKTWANDEWVGYAVRITSGAAEGEVHRIVSNTIDTITISGAGWVASVSDSDGYEISLTCQIKVPSNGKFLMPGRLTYTGNATGIRGLAVYKNNVPFYSDYNNPLGTVESSIKSQAFVHNFQKNDILEFYAYQSSGSNLTLLSLDLRNCFQLIAQRGV